MPDRITGSKTGSSKTREGNSKQERCKGKTGEIRRRKAKGPKAEAKAARPPLISFKMERRTKSWQSLEKSQRSFLYW
jgi:hypothetical protein